MISTILVPLDGSALAEAALPVAEAVAALAGAGVTLMQVAATSGPLRGLSEDEVEVRLGWEYEAAAERDARSYLAAVAQRFAATPSATRREAGTSDWKASWTAVRRG